MMKATATLVPKHLEKAIDLARNVATFGQLEFTASFVRMRITDPVKVLHLDLLITPDMYKCDTEFAFGINLQMLHKLFKSLDNNEEVQIEADETVMKIHQGLHYHTLLNQPLQTPVPSVEPVVGPKLVLGTKMFQRYIRALGNAAPVVELHYDPNSNVLFLESVSSMYRTLFSVDTTSSPNDPATGEYRKQFIIRFLDSAINASLADQIELTLGDSLQLYYNRTNVQVWVTQATYTEG